MSEGILLPRFPQCLRFPPISVPIFPGSRRNWHRRGTLIYNLDAGSRIKKTSTDIRYQSRTISSSCFWDSFRNYQILMSWEFDLSASWERRDSGIIQRDVRGIFKI